MKLRTLSTVMIAIGVPLVAAVLVKFGYELILGLRGGLAIGAAATDVLSRIVMGPEMRDQIFFYIAVIGFGQLGTGLSLRFFPPLGPDPDPKK